MKLKELLPLLRNEPFMLIIGDWEKPPRGYGLR